MPSLPFTSLHTIKDLILDHFDVLQSSIAVQGFRSLREGEDVEFEREVGEDGRSKAVRVTGPQGAPPQVRDAYRKFHLLPADPARKGGFVSDTFPRRERSHAALPAPPLEAPPIFLNFNGIWWLRSRSNKLKRVSRGFQEHVGLPDVSFFQAGRTCEPGARGVQVRESDVGFTEAMVKMIASSRHRRCLQ
jgi:hypothetical protein